MSFEVAERQEVKSVRRQTEAKSAPRCTRHLPARTLGLDTARSTVGPAVVVVRDRGGGGGGRLGSRAASSAEEHLAHAVAHDGAESDTSGGRGDL